MNGFRCGVAVLVLAMMVAVLPGCGSGGGGGGSASDFIAPPSKAQLIVQAGADHSGDTVAPGDSNIVLELIVSALNEDVIIDTLVINALGSANDPADIESMKILEDTDNDGQIDKELLVDKDIGGGPRIFQSDNGSITFFLNPRQLIQKSVDTRRWLVVAKIRNTVFSGQTFGVAATDMAARNLHGANVNPAFQGAVQTGGGGGLITLRREMEASAGGSNPPDGVADPGTADVPLIHVEMHWPYSQTVTLDQMTFAVTLLNGATVGDFSNLNLLLDEDNDGTADDFLATAALGATSITFVGINHDFSPGAVDSLIVTADFGGGIADMEGLRLSLANSTSAIYSDLFAITSGTPVTGGNVISTQPVVADISVATTTPDEDDVTLELDGTGSTDPDIGGPGGGIATWLWEIVNIDDMPAGTTIEDADQAIATLVMTNTKTPYSPEIRLTVTGTDTTVDTAEVTIDVQVDDDIVVALQSPSTGTPDEEDGVILFDGSGSFDPDIEDSIATYLWEVVASPSPNVTIDEPTMAMTNVNLANRRASYDIEIRLTVTSTDGSMDTDTTGVMTVTCNNDAPAAAIDFIGHGSVLGGSKLQLDAATSTDPDEDDALTWQWALQGTPPGGTRFADTAGPSSLLETPVLETTNTGATHSVGVQLTATDIGGLNNITSMNINVENPTLLALDGENNTLLQVGTAEGFTRRVAASPLGFLDITDAVWDDTNNILYAVDGTYHELLTINTTTGKGTRVGGIGSDDVRAIAYDSDANLLYGIDGTTGELLKINIANGFGSVVFETGLVGVESMVYLPALPGFLACTGEDIYQVRLTGSVIFVASLSGGQAGFSIKSMGLDSGTDTLYGIDPVNQEFFTIGRTTGVMVSLGDFTTSAYTNVEAIAVDSAIANVYGIDNDLDLLFTLQKNDPTVFATVGPVGLNNIDAAVYQGSTGSVIFADNTSQRLVKINVSTGLVTLSTGSFGGNVNISGLTLSGATLYGADSANDMLVTINTTTGAVANVGAFVNATNVQAIALDTGTDTLYAADPGTGNLFTVNKATGEATAIGAMGVNIVGMAYDPSVNKLYGVTTNRMYEINRTTGATTAIGTGGITGGGASCLAKNLSTGEFYTYEGSNDRLIEIKVTNSTIDAGFHMLGYAGVDSLAWDSDFDTLYGYDNGRGQLITIDPATGVGSQKFILDTVGALTLTGLAYNPTTDRLLTVNTQNSKLMTINPLSGVTAEIADVSAAAVSALTYTSVTSRLYAFDAATSAVGIIDTATGNFTQVADLTGRLVKGMSINSSASLIYAVDINNHELITIATVSGVVTVVGPTPHILIEAMTFYEP